MHIYNGHIIVCASWGEVRARVHAKHTHTEEEREKDECVCGRCMALSPSLSRGHRSSRRTRNNNKKKQKRGGGVGCIRVLTVVLLIC
ncbi:hypothetical protein TCDM_13208 [Trypanosoma cruzi Dm28c]|uniref:Uncharacterized protein n=1 Tax=Trypanosoma cruzi Dm28c TaxID=1416333 RepID=V5A3G1_TRYCR|nr:hypothetical protein TCDM_13208 [Trypanosoma cruzi Dm28c]